jgi:hypothetical protein
MSKGLTTAGSFETAPGPAGSFDHDEPTPLLVKEHPDLEADPTRAIILAAYKGNAARVADLLLGGVSATVSIARKDAVELLGEDVYLGSHSWSTQEGFPVMYFAGECWTRRRRPRAMPPSRPSRDARPPVASLEVTFSRESLCGLGLTAFGRSLDCGDVGQRDAVRTASCGERVVCLVLASRALELSRRSYTGVRGERVSGR